MKKIVRKSHKKEIAYELAKTIYPDKTGRGGGLNLYLLLLDEKEGEKMLQ